MENTLKTDIEYTKLLPHTENPENGVKIHVEAVNLDKPGFIQKMHDLRAAGYVRAAAAYRTIFYIKKA